MEHAFANILLTGPCNLRCPDCIGGQVRSARDSNLDVYPLPGLQAFSTLLRQRGIRQVSVTGIDTEPMLYRHTHALVDHLRNDVPGVQLSLHTNGTRVLADLTTVHAYDRVAISVPSLDPKTCRAMTGSARVLDLAAIHDRVRIPIKLSVLMTEHNRREIPSLLRTIRSLGYHRAVLRRRYGETNPYDPLSERRPLRSFGGNPVYDLNGLEVTVWDFDNTHLPCVNLFPDGFVRRGYLLTEVACA
jgi:molybdenum cofactor biosynthesis enzyme MoaA